MIDSSLRLRFWVSLVLFISAYAPLMIIMVIKQIDLTVPLYLKSPIISFGLLGAAFFSSIIVLFAVQSVHNGLNVEVSKASNKSGDMFGYTIPYMLSFMKINFYEWQTVLAIFLFLSVLFVMAYRTQTVFINPILAVSGYMLIDCSLKRGSQEMQAMVITKKPIQSGELICLERLSYYLYIRSNSDYKESKEQL